MAKATVESDVEFYLRVVYLSNGTARVEMIADDDCCFADIKTATGYLMWLVADKSDLEFDEALTDLCDYAKKFRPLLRVVPEKEVVDEEES